MKKSKCLFSFIVGLIGSIFGLFGGFCTTMCSCINSDSAFLLIFGGGVVGMIGTCLCLNKAKIGSIIQFIGGIMIMIRAYGMGGAELMSIFAMLLLLIAGMVGFIYTFFIHKSKE